MFVEMLRLVRVTLAIICIVVFPNVALLRLAVFNLAAVIVASVIFVPETPEILPSVTAELAIAAVRRAEPILQRISDFTKGDVKSILNERGIDKLITELKKMIFREH